MRRGHGRFLICTKSWVHLLSAFLVPATKHSTCINSCHPHTNPLRWVPIISTFIETEAEVHDGLSSLTMVTQPVNGWGQDLKPKLWLKGSTKAILEALEGC